MELGHWATEEEKTRQKKLKMSLLSLTNSFKPTHYDLELSIDMEKSNFMGLAEISLTRSSSSSEFQFSLHSAELVVLSAIFVPADASSGQDAQFKSAISYDKNSELVNFKLEEPEKLLNHEKLVLKLKYLGKINTIKTFKDFTKGIFKTNYLDDRNNTATNYILATHSQAAFARYIFPSVDEPVSKTTFKLSITTNSRFKVLSNSSIETQIGLSGSCTKTIFKITPIMNTSIFAFVVGDLDYIESKVKLIDGEIPIRFYAPIGQVSYAAYPLDVTTKALPFIESMLNYAYPLDKLDFVALPFLSDGAMENFGLITIQSTHILATSLNTEICQGMRQLVVHELVHHWIGNNVSFDEWTHLWLNESFATWFAYYVLYKLKLEEVDQEIWLKQGDEELESYLLNDSQPDVSPIAGNSNKKAVKSTQEAFEVASYQKGIHFLRMLANVFESDKFDDNLDKFVASISKFIHTKQFKAIKPTDLWIQLNNESNLDLLAFTHSWLRLPGIPVVTVKLNQDGLIELTQNRYLSNGLSLDSLNLENNPYHIPLAIKLTDGSIVNRVMNDRSLVLTEIKPSEFVKLNSNRIGLYRTNYVNTEFYKNIGLNLDKLTDLDLLNIVYDFNSNLGVNHSNDDLLGFIKLSEYLIDSKELNFKILPHILTSLEILQDSIKLSNKEHNKLKYSKWLQQQNLKLFNKLSWDEDSNDFYKKLSKDELDTRKWILTIGIETPEGLKVANKLFKYLLHGPSQTVPIQLVQPVLSIISFNSNQNSWKKILELVKSPGPITNNVFGTNNATQEIQNAAVRSIGFTKDEALVKRVLNFVSNNIDSTMVELSLIGLQYNQKMNKDALWSWFNLNYDQWVSRSLRPGSEYSANLKKTVKSITFIVFSGLNVETDKNMIDKFIELKLKKLPEHGLVDNVAEVKELQLEKIKITKTLDSIINDI